jgi:hypothetical protein
MTDDAYATSANTITVVDKNGTRRAADTPFLVQIIFSSLLAIPFFFVESRELAYVTLLVAICLPYTLLGGTIYGLGTIDGLLDTRIDICVSSGIIYFCRTWRIGNYPISIIGSMEGYDLSSISRPRIRYKKTPDGRQTTLELEANDQDGRALIAFNDIDEAILLVDKITPPEPKTNE